MEDAPEGAACARSGNNVARVERDNAGDFSGFASFVQLPLSKNVYRQPDQIRMAERACLADHRPEPVGGFENV